ncbi:MAG TPA: hypothetical protein VF607_00290, partial [Verrucomicrobiae bacterium]
ANGGCGVTNLSGSGGGGMISVACTSNLFQGNITAYGGPGGLTPDNNGYLGAGPGTIYITNASLRRAQLTLDNGGNTTYVPTPFNETDGHDLILTNGARININAVTKLNNVLIYSNSVLQPSYVVSATNFSVFAGGQVNLDNTIVGGTLGSSSGATAPYYACSGAGHGGRGGMGAPNPTGSPSPSPGGTSYDVINSPQQGGSQGGYSSVQSSFGGNGGGYAQLVVANQLQVDGTVSVNGGNGSGTGGGGGSGGGINLSCNTFKGSGLLAANGGNGVSNIGGGGGGGMIAVTFYTSQFSGQLTAYGGTGYQAGGAGTIYLNTNSPIGPSGPLLILDNGGLSGTNTPVNLNNANLNWVIRNGAIVQPQLVSLVIKDLFIGSNAMLIPYNFNGTLNLTISGKTTIQTGGVLNGDRAGGAMNTGSGPGHSSNLSPTYSSSGGSHGGYGGLSGTNAVLSGNTYDSTMFPSSPGSGGGGFSATQSPGGMGGALLSLTFNGDVQLDGAITANGGTGIEGGGGGAGGGIRINLYNQHFLRGAGRITANGGAGGTYGGGGGGGRIALYYFNSLIDSNNFKGSITAYGGAGANNGGAGTIFLQVNGANTNQLILDNGGLNG